MASNTLGTSYADFVEQLAALSVTGVTRTYTEPPQQISATDLSIMYLELPSGTEGALTAQSAGGWPQMACNLVVLVNPAMQDTSAANYAASIAMIDALSTAPRSANYLGKTSPSWSIRVDRVFAGASLYWAVIAEVRTSG